MATEKDITIHRGGSYELVVKLLDEDGSAVDPTGTGIHYRIARTKSSDAIITVDTADINTEQDGDDWKATVQLTSTRTKLLSASKGYYHELYLDDGGELSVMMTGAINVKEAQAAQHS